MGSALSKWAILLVRNATPGRRKQMMRTISTAVVIVMKRLLAEMTSQQSFPRHLPIGTREQRPIMVTRLAALVELSMVAGLAVDEEDAR
jgi:hypothetical protein